MHLGHIVVDDYAQKFFHCKYVYAAKQKTAYTLGTGRVFQIEISTLQ
jgi:hypothetical protein